MPIFHSKSAPEKSRQIPSKWRKSRLQQKTEDPTITSLSADLAPLPLIEETSMEMDFGRASADLSGQLVEGLPPERRSYDHPARPNMSMLIPIPRSASSSESGKSGRISPATLPTSFNATPPLRIDEDEEIVFPPPPNVIVSGSHPHNRLMEPSETSRKGSASSARSLRRTASQRSSSPLLPPPNTVDSRIPASALLPLRIKDGTDAENIRPIVEDDPQSFDLIMGVEQVHPEARFDLEKQAQLLFSSQHLWQVLSDTKLNREFAAFLASKRPWRLPIFNYYTKTVKAIRAIEYGNCLVGKITPVPSYTFTMQLVPGIRSTVLEKNAQQAFEDLVSQDLPQFVAHAWIDMVSTTILRRITGTLVPDLVETSQGLAEVFCLTDPSRPDNPIVMASREFSRTTQYGSAYILGRNCRFLQGPHTSRQTVGRIQDAIGKKQSCLELILNYRRDGSPFLNLLSIAPLFDDKRELTYFIGAQIDVSNLAKGAYGLEGFRRLLDGSVKPPQYKGEFKHLAELFDEEELACVRKFGGTALVDNPGIEEGGLGIVGPAAQEPRVLLRDDPGPSPEMRAAREAVVSAPEVDGKLNGVFQNFLLIRPAPSVRILFTSPSMRDDEILQSYFPDRLGGSTNVRHSVVEALESGREVTARVLWKVNAHEGRACWIHCTPLFVTEGVDPTNIGAWMVVMVDDQNFREA